MDFETLLKEKELLRKESTVITKVGMMETKGALPRQKSDKGATLFEAIELIAKIVKLTMPNVVFIPDEGRVVELDAMNKIERPVITYTVIDRVPKMEFKPRIREQIIEKDIKDGTERVGEVWGQRFECVVQFNIYASVYKEAEEVMEMFEEALFKYAGFLKRNGVGEIFFKEHVTDSHFDTMRETLSIRNLRYYVEIEKLTVIFKEKIQQIESQIQNLSLD